MVNRMDRIDLIRSFVTVVEAGSFTAAAARLGISNKLVSKYIAALEGQLGTALLHRTTRTLSLTDAGERYLNGARRVLAALDEAEADLRGSAGLTGRLRIAAPVTFGEQFVTPHTRDYLAAHPGIEVELALSDSIVDLARGGFDLAVRIGTLRDSSLIARRLGTTRLIVVASPDYLDRHGTPDRPEALRDHACILDSNNPTWQSWRFTVEGREVQVPVHGRFVANSAPACLTLARAGDGLALTVDLFCAADLAEGRLVQVLRAFPAAEVPIQMVHLPSAFRAGKLRHYMDFLAARFAQHQTARA